MCDATTMNPLRKSSFAPRLRAAAVLAMAALALSAAAAPAPMNAARRAAASGAKPLTGYRIGLDAGQGGEAATERTNLDAVDPWMHKLEAEANLRVGMLLEQYLAHAGASVATSFARSGAAPADRLAVLEAQGVDFILSIHHSYSFSPRDNLTAAYYDPAGNDDVEGFARRANEALSHMLGLPRTGAMAVKHPLASGSGTPSILLVCSLMSNLDEFMRLMEPAYNRLEAEAIMRGLINYAREKAGFLKKTSTGLALSTPPAWRTLLAQSAAAAPAAPASGPDLPAPAPLESLGSEAEMFPPGLNEDEMARAPIAAPSFAATPAAPPPAPPSPSAASLPALAMPTAAPELPDELPAPRDIAEAAGALPPIAPAPGSSEAFRAAGVEEPSDWMAAYEKLARQDAALRQAQIESAAALGLPEPSGPAAKPAPLVWPPPRSDAAAALAPAPTPGPAELRPEPLETPVPIAPPEPLTALSTPEPLPPLIPLEPARTPLVPVPEHPIRERESLIPFTGELRSPVEASIDQTWLFGEQYKTNPLKRGVSFSVAAGADVRAAAAGTVVEANFTDRPAPLLAYPRSVLIEHDTKIDGLPVYTMYGQLASISVTQGQKVAAGEPIGKTGQPYDMATDNRSTELEFEVWIGGKSVEYAVNPELYIQPVHSGNGIIVGQIVDEEFRALPGRRIDGVVKSPATHPNYTFSLSYAPGVNPSPQWEENFVIGDVPPGVYDLAFPGGFKQQAVVEAGKITYLTVGLE